MKNQFFGTFTKGKYEKKIIENFSKKIIFSIKKFFHKIFFNFIKKILKNFFLHIPHF